MGKVRIVKQLNKEGLLTRNGNTWSPETIHYILTNYSYTGNLILQTTYSENHLTKKNKINRGELPMYRAEKTHEAIISIEDFYAVQAEKARRAELVKRKNNTPIQTFPFTGLLRCAVCGSYYGRRTTITRKMWICHNYIVYGKDKCASKQIPEETLEKVTIDLLGSLERLNEIDYIEVDNGNKLTFVFKDGRKEECTWKDRSRSESWTEEKRIAFGEMRKRRNAECHK